MDPREYLRLSLDPLRLGILGRAAERSVDIADIAARHGVPERNVRVALGKLRSAGLIDEGLGLDRTVLRRVAENLPTAPAADPAVVGEGWTAEEADVLNRFFSRDRLVSIPTSRGKRRIVLERLALEFEPGVRYQEADVNFSLQLYHPDYAALRRYLVDESLLTRADGVYWRTGGRFVPEASPGD